MSRSQRHAVYIRGTDAAGKGLSEKQPAPVYIQQYLASQAFTVPTGALGGPLKGSTIAGFPPTLIPAPGLLAERDAEIGARDESSFEAPGQFNNSGNPRYQDLPATNEPEPAPGPPVVDSINPNSAAIGDPAQLVNVNGSNFASLAAVLVDDTKLVTTFLSDTQLQITLDPGDAAAVFTVVVQNPDGQESNTSTFTVGSVGGREFPTGPIVISRIERTTRGLAVTISGGDVRVGDQITVEASGNTNINGSWTVVSVDGNVVVVDNDYKLATPIDAKGRLIIDGGPA